MEIEVLHRLTPETSQRVFSPRNIVSSHTNDQYIYSFDRFLPSNAMRVKMLRLKTTSEKRNIPLLSICDEDRVIRVWSTSYKFNTRWYILNEMVASVS